MTSNKSITVTGLDEIIDRLKVADTQTNIAVMSFLRGWSQDAVKLAQAEIDAVDAVDLGELRGGIHYQTSSNPPESVIQPSDFAQRYAKPLELGSKPHFPPIKAIEGWAMRRGLNPYAVARGISIHGTKPRHFWERTFEQTDKKVSSELSDLGAEIIRRL